MVAHRKLDSCLSALMKYVSGKYDGRAAFELASKYDVGFGYILDDINQMYPLSVVIGSADLYNSDSQTFSTKGKSINDIAAFVVSVFHECRHVEQFNMMQNVVNKDAQYMSLNHLAAHHNPTYDHDNRRISIAEIDAERFAISMAGQFLSKTLGQPKLVDKLMLDYVNKKVQNDKHYFIEFPSGKFKYEDIDAALDAFDEAYDVAKHTPRSYNVLICNDESYNFLMREVKPEFRNRCFDESNGMVQMAMIAATVLYNHPDYQGWHKSLQYMDLSMETMFGKDWQRSDKPKPVRRLPDMPVDIYDPSGQCEP